MNINIWRTLMTVIFFIVFLLIVLWTLDKEKNELFKDASRLPFDDE